MLRLCISVSLGMVFADGLDTKYGHYTLFSAGNHICFTFDFCLTSSLSSALSASSMRLADVAWRGSSIVRREFSSTSSRAASAPHVRPLALNASTNAAFAAMSIGTATYCSLASRKLGEGRCSSRLMRPATASSSASRASRSASFSSDPDVRHSGRSRNDTTTSSSPYRRSRAG